MGNNCNNCAQKDRPACLPPEGQCNSSTNFHKWQPIRPPQCTTYAKLHERMVHLYKMCEGTSVTVLECIRKNGGDVSHVRGEPIFDGKPEEYEFACFIVEGKQAFRGDTLYGVHSEWKYTIDDRGIAVAPALEDGITLRTKPTSLSWNPPRRTIKIGEVEVPAPKFVGYSYEYAKEKFTVNVEYANKDDAEAFKDALKKEQP